MFYFIKKPTIAILLICISGTLSAQQTTKGFSKGKAGKTNFTLVAQREIFNPVKQKLQLPPEEEDDDEIKIQNPVDIDKVAPFTGKLTVIKPPVLNSNQVIEEFPCNNFNAIDDNAVTAPPDVNGAVGFDYLMATLNSQIRIQNKQGTAISTNSLDGFWNGLGGHTDIFDPKITYDPYDKRWFFVCCADRSSTTSALLLGVSQTPDPTGGWITYTIKADPGNKLWFDYPSLGFNRNWITVGGYLFKIPGATGAADTVQRSRVWVIDKSVVYAANPNITVTFFDRTDYFHISPAVTYDANDNTQWLSTVHNNNSSNNGFLRLFSITGTQAAPVFNTGSIINVGGAWGKSGPTGPQLGTNTGVALGDDRILQSTFRGGTLWAGNNAFLPAVTPTTCVAQVVSINPSNSTVLENIRTAADNNTMQAYPSITVNSNNDIFFGYSAFRNTAYVTSTISYRRNNGQGFFFYYFKGGEDWYVNLNPVSGLNRWGDYTATFIDPEDDVTAWTIQEYARPRVGNSTSSGRWGTWWAKICPGFCLNNLVLSSAVNNTMKKYEANSTITSTSLIQNNSTIKYDAGVKITLSPGFKVIQGNKLHAYIEGCGGVQ